VDDFKQLDVRSPWIYDNWNISLNTEYELNDGYPFLSWEVNDSEPVWYIPQYE
jgi:hypothetical protein